MKKIFFISIFLLAAHTAHAQYYSWGADVTGLQWRQLKSDSVRVIYPTVAETLGRKVFHYATVAHPHASYGYKLPPLKRMPFVVHPENFQSNGLVMWMPRRIEMLSTPADGTYATPWLKQLVAHEYRHAVQYRSFNRGFVRVASWFLGQQGSIIGNPFMYMWALEGDAVMLETEMTTYGRGLQPRFTLEYRALGRHVMDRRNTDKWFCGSYREFVPDHYQLGYQLVRYMYNRYGDDVWDRTLHYAVRNAYMLMFSTGVGLRKMYDTHSGKIFVDAFTNLNDHWESLPEVEDSTTPLTELPDKTYTVYQYPQMLVVGDDVDQMLALKTDFDRPSRFVVIDRDNYTGQTDEWLVFYTGSLSSRPDTDGERLWWTEYRQSLLFPERVNSKIVYADPFADTRWRPRIVRGIRNALFPTYMGEGRGLAWVEYAPNGNYTVVTRDGERFPIPEGIEVHGMAWDNVTEKLYLLLTGDEGMWISTLAGEAVTQPSYVTLSDLRAAAGKLYFGSNASGRDEAHCVDLKTEQEYRITTSRYGSFSPDGPSGLVTTYSDRGYAVAKQEIDSLIPVTPRHTPVDLVNPAMRRWDVVNLDTVKFTSVTQAQQPKQKRYSKTSHLFNVHSWAPVSFDPFGLIEEFRPDLMLGATILTQNRLSTLQGYASWGWSPHDRHVFHGKVRYSGLGVRFEAGATYGGEQSIINLPQQIKPIPARHWEAYVGATLPLTFDAGYHIRQLSLSSAYSYSNALVGQFGKLGPIESLTTRDIISLGYNEGMQKLSFGVGFSDVVRSAYRDVATPWGYLLAADHAFNPTNRDFSHLVSGYARLYTPGFFRHHSLVLAGIYQTSLGGWRANESPMLAYTSNRLVPKGFSIHDIVNDRYTAASLDYQLPIWYPDGGWQGFLYFKRLRLNAGGQYARFLNAGTWQQLYSYGIDLYIDGNILRGPHSSTWTLRLSLYKPNRPGVWFGFNIETPL